MRKQTLVSSLTTRFILVELTLGRMPIFTRRSRASAFQIISARLSKNGPNGYFCLGYFSSSAHFDVVIRLAQKVWRQCVQVFAHDLGLRGGNCIGLLANTALFLSTGNQILEWIGVSSFLQFCPNLCLVYQNKSCTKSFLIQVPRMTNDCKETCEHTLKLQQHSDYILLYCRFLPIQCHLTSTWRWFYRWNARRESWKDVPFELYLHTIDAIQFLEVRIPFNLNYPSCVWVPSISPIQSTESEKTQTLEVWSDNLFRTIRWSISM